MPNFFPIQTSELKFEEPKAFRRFSFSLIEMALVTGVLLRVYRVLVVHTTTANIMPSYPLLPTS